MVDLTNVGILSFIVLLVLHKVDYTLSLVWVSIYLFFSICIITYVEQGLNTWLINILSTYFDSEVLSSI